MRSMQKKKRLERLMEFLNHQVERANESIMYEMTLKEDEQDKRTRKFLRQNYNMIVIKDLKDVTPKGDPALSENVDEKGRRGMIREFSDGEEFNDNFLYTLVDFINSRVSHHIDQLIVDIDAEIATKSEKDIRDANVFNFIIHLLIGIFGILLCYISVTTSNNLIDEVDFNDVSEVAITKTVGGAVLIFTFGVHYGAQLFFYGISMGESPKHHLQRYPIHKKIGGNGQ